MARKFIIIILLDIALIALWDYWVNSIDVPQGAAIAVILLVPAIIIASGLVGVYLQFKNRPWGKVMISNVLIALVIFGGVFKYESWKQVHDNYLNFYFTDKDKTYNIILKRNKAQLQNGMEYYFYERLGENGNGGTDLDGSYIIKADTIILTSYKGKLMKIYENTLLDYPNEGNIRILKDNP